MCRLCRVALTYDAAGAASTVLPPIRAGEAVVARDLTRAALVVTDARNAIAPTRNAVTHGPDGTSVAFVDNAPFFYEEHAPPKLRDACVRVTVATWGDGVEARVLVRCNSVAHARFAYSFMIAPSRRAWSIDRHYVAARAADGLTVLRHQEDDARVKGDGEAQVVELAAHGATLQASIDGQLVHALHDPSFGVGHGAIHLLAPWRRGAPPRRALLRSFSVHLVKP
jgi:hypothetical protein